MIYLSSTGDVESDRLRANHGKRLAGRSMGGMRLFVKPMDYCR